jgi:hypothetical protein
MANLVHQHPKPPGRKARQPIGVTILKPRPAKAKRAAARKAKALLNRLGPEFGEPWEHLELKPLEQRVHDLRRLAERRHLSNAEWDALDAMRDRMRALAKFAQAVREVQN